MTNFFSSRAVRIAGWLAGTAGLTACGGGAPSLPNISTQGVQSPGVAGCAERRPSNESGRRVLAPHLVPPLVTTVDAAHARELVRYHCGTVQIAPKIYVAFWGFHTDPMGEAMRLTGFMNAVAASSWLNTVTQYYQAGPQYVANPSGQLAGTWYDDANPVPAHPSDFEIQAEAKRLARHFAVYDANASYVVATPTQHNTAGFPRNFCAYHGDAVERGVPIPYTNLPYVSDAGRSCGANSVNSGPAGKLDGVTIVGGHELAETQTDPTGGGWYDAGGNEIGDKCAWWNLANTNFGSFGSYPTQPLWSNAAAACVQ